MLLARRLCELSTIFMWNGEKETSHAKQWERHNAEHPEQQYLIFNWLMIALRIQIHARWMCICFIVISLIGMADWLASLPMHTHKKNNCLFSFVIRCHFLEIDWNHRRISIVADWKRGTLLLSLFLSHLLQCSPWIALSIYRIDHILRCVDGKNKFRLIDFAVLKSTNFVYIYLYFALDCVDFA